MGTLAEDAMNVTKAAVEEGFVGDGCILLRLASKVDSIIESLENDKQQVGTEIARKTLNYPFKFIVNKIRRAVTGSCQATEVWIYAGKYEDLMAAGIIDPYAIL